MPPKWRTKLKHFFRGLRRREAHERQDGVRPTTVGKHAMPQRLYVWLCEHFLVRGNIFAWAYLTLSWNSMARTNNVADIHLSHLVPADDALGICFPRTKTDQTGRRANVHFRLYANPYDMCQCSVTALGALLLLDETHRDEKLFLGNNQARRFARDLEEALATPEGQAVLAAVGRTADAISPHSTRKGSAVYASNGTTDAPSFSAICQRAGWSIGSVLNRYFHYDGAMDAYLGRLLAGLDVASVRFTVLPPHFASDQVSPADLFQCFPGHRARPALAPVLRFVLPSLLVHRTRLLERLPATHRLRHTRLFVDEQLRNALLCHVVDTSFEQTPLDSPYLKATGIPSHVSFMRQGDAIIASVNQLLLQQQQHQQPPTVPNAPSDPPTVAAVEKELAESQRTPTGFPLNMELPLVGPYAAWRLLLRGSPERHIPPYRLLKPGEFPGNVKLRKRICDWLFFYRAVCERVQLDEATAQRLARNHDETELSALFHRAWSSFNFDDVRVLSSGRLQKVTTRPDQWKLNTAIARLRQQLKSSPSGAQQRRRRPLSPINEPPATLPSALADSDDGEHAGRTRQLWTRPRKRDVTSTAAAAFEHAADNVYGRTTRVAKPGRVAIDYSSFL